MQWEISTNGGSTWSAVAGATTGQLAIENATASENGHQYRAVFTNAAGKATSSAALLTVATSHFSAVGWGDNVYRQLGDGFKEHFSDVPVPVTGLQFVTAVAAGGRHSLALLADGTVVAWGANGLGQLGNGGTTESNVPVAVEGLSGVKAISAGASHSLALLTNGTVMAWGDNESGQLGIGSSVEDSEVPVAVKGLTSVKAISAGAELQPRAPDERDGDGLGRERKRAAGHRQHQIEQRAGRRQTPDRRLGDLRRRRIQPRAPHQRNGSGLGQR